MTHKEEKRIRHQKLRSRRIAEGVCTLGCGRKAKAGILLCDICSEKAKEQKKIHYKKLSAQRVAEGICIKGCGRKAKGDVQTCEECSKKQKEKDEQYVRKGARRKCENERNSQRIAEGFCIKGCGKKAKEGIQICEECAAKSVVAKKTRYEKYRSLGLCVSCGRNEVCGCVLCVICYLKRTARVTLGDQSRWEFIRDLFDRQKGICPYTGRQLRLGYDTSLDHILPRSRDGSNDDDNLQWVYDPINKMKHNRTHDEFISLSYEVARYAGVCH